MYWLFAVSWTLIFAGSYAFGVWLGFRPRKIVTAGTALCLAAILLRAFFRYYPNVEYALFPYDTYAFLHPWWIFPCGFAILGVGIKQIGSPRLRAYVTAFAGLLFILSVERLVIMAVFDPASCTGRPGKYGICMQTTSYTCGAAAASTLLARIGIDSDEREMAILCYTNSLTGTDEISVCKGLRTKLLGTGRQVNLVRSDWEGLCSTNLPVMASMSLTVLIDHWVVVMDVDDEWVILGDPASGRIRMAKDMFLEYWRNMLVTVEEG